MEEALQISKELMQFTKDQAVELSHERKIKSQQHQIDNGKVLLEENGDFMDAQEKNYFRKKLNELSQSIVIPSSADGRHGSYVRTPHFADRYAYILGYTEYIPNYTMLPCNSACNS